MTGFDSKRNAAQAKMDDDTQVYADRKRGSIALARSLCYQINGAADDSDDIDGGGYGSVDVAEILSAEVVRLQAALAQPEQEPCIGKDPRCPCQDGDACHYKDCGNTKARPVPPAQPEQEPVASIYISQSGEREFDDWKCKLPIGRNLLYNTPPAPQRKWVGLDEDEIRELYGKDLNYRDGNYVRYAMAVEAKLKERNT